MPEKHNFAMYWAAGCGGCEIAVLNTHEKLLDIDAAFNVVFWPVAVDTKYADVEVLPDKAIQVCFFNGAIRSDENEAMARLLRRKSLLLVAFGACACEGGIPGLANLSTTQELIETAFSTSSSEVAAGFTPQPHYAAPEGELHLPTLCESVRTLDQVVDVDFYMPGCPPESAQIAAVVTLAIQALNGEAELPPKGSVIGAGNSTVCDECKRARGEKNIREFKRMATFQPNPVDCLLEQGLLCAGEATRSGCGALCPAANMPCSGCYGPAVQAYEQGARMLSSLASVAAGSTHAEIGPLLDEIVDPLGSFYRYSLANSTLRRARPQPPEERQE
ncbi:MAG TPA: oxidoreductase [Polyangia bacterium]